MANDIDGWKFMQLAAADAAMTEHQRDVLLMLRLVHNVDHYMSVQDGIQIFYRIEGEANNKLILVSPDGYLVSVIYVSDSTDKVGRLQKRVAKVRLIDPTPEGIREIDEYVGHLGSL